MDVTALVVGVLSEALDVPVSTESPWKDTNTPLPKRLVTVDLAGDRSDQFILRPIFQLVCWGATDQEAHGIARACLDALWGAAEDHPYLSACQLESMARDTWAANGQARYIVTVDLTINTDE